MKMETAIVATLPMILAPAVEPVAKTAKTLNAESKRFAANRHNSGTKGLALIVERLRSAMDSGDIMPLIFLADALGGTDGARVKAIAVWATDGALKSKKDKAGRFTYTLKALDREASADVISWRIATLASMVTAPFTGAAVSALIAKEAKDPVEFDREKYLATVLKRLGDEECNVVGFAADLVRLAAAAKAAGN